MMISKTFLYNIAVIYIIGLWKLLPIYTKAFSTIKQYIMIGQSTHSLGDKVQNILQGRSNKNESISPASKPIMINHFEKRIEQALSIKNDGNQEFKAHRYDEARNIYQKALGLLEPNTFYGATEAQCQKMAELSANILFNIGSCFFNQQKWKQAELIYNQAVTINPHYVKAIYKRALSRYQQQQYQGAMADIKTAFNFDKSNKEIYQSYERILVKYNECVKKDREKSKELSSKIFNPKPKQKEEVPPKDEEGSNYWWAVALLTPIIGFGLVKGFKYFSK